MNVLQRSTLDDITRWIYPDGKLDIIMREPRTRRAHPTLLAYVVNRVKPERFSQIRDQFCDIFPVDDVDIKERELSDGQVQLVLRIRDRGSSTWIEEAEMSDGMLRTLKLLIEISFAAPGNVFLVDEIENGMGTNCLPEVTRAMLNRLDCQFVITSHHPLGHQ
jgi:predicted ATPase